MKSYQSLQPDDHTLLLIDLGTTILLELNDDLLEEIAYVLVVFKVCYGSCNHLLVFLR